MAYDSKTLEALHSFTPEGQDYYQQMLEQKADEILFKHQHPLKWAACQIMKLIKKS